MKIRLKIRKYDDNHIDLQALSGIDHFGFGTFLCKLKPGEIDSDKFSKNAMINAKEQTGLNGMEIWSDNRIAWGNPDHHIIMPISEISCQQGADWIKKIKAK